MDHKGLAQRRSQDLSRPLEGDAVDEQLAAIMFDQMFGTRDEGLPEGVGWGGWLLRKAGSNLGRRQSLHHK